MRPATQRIVTSRPELTTPDRISGSARFRKIDRLQSAQKLRYATVPESGTSIMQSEREQSNAFTAVIGTIGGRTANEVASAAARRSRASQRARSADKNGSGDGSTT
jgi:hypothetical protein